jgi:hypothetical protein
MGFHMSLGYCYKKAVIIVQQLPAGSRSVRDVLCRRIKDAERNLNAAAASRLKGCLEDCRGLCCRNLQLDAVFGIPDFVYLLSVEPALESKMAECLRRENPFFTSNCPFLAAGVGPCLFPSDVRPEVCITSFCRGDETLKSEIRRVKMGFWKLGVFLHLRKVPRIHRLLFQIGQN